MALRERVESVSGVPVPRGRALSFSFDGRSIEGVSGDSVASALHAAGERALMRSIKYHRPRGFFCGVGTCSSCLVRVDGVPNVRACVTPAREGMRVESQNALPRARFDVLSVVDRVYRRRFDHHAKFIRPGFLKPVFHGVVRRMAGFGRLPAAPAVAPRRPAMERLAPDVAVVGGGAAGLAAAAAAARSGARVLLVDEQASFGGSLAFGTPDGEGGRDAAERFAREIAAGKGDARAGVVAVGLYREGAAAEPHDPSPEAGSAGSVGELVLMGSSGLAVAAPRALVVAAGAHEVPPLFPSNDLPGIMGARAAQILLFRHGVLPGGRVAVVGEGERADALASQLASAGAEVVARAREEDVERAHGGTRVTGLTLASGARVACDAVVAATLRAPRVELLQQADCAMEHDAARGGFVPRLVGKSGETSTRGVFAAGSCAGVKRARESLAEGARAGEAAARHASGGRGA